MIEAGDDFLLRFFITVFFGDQTDFYGAIDDIGKQFQREFVFVELEDVSRTANFFAIAFRNFLRPKPELRLSVFVRADRNVAVNFGDVRNRPASSAAPDGNIYSSLSAESRGSLLSASG